MVGGDEIMANVGLSWLLAVKLWLVVGGGSKIMVVVGRRGWFWVMGVKLWLVEVSCRWWLQNYGWSWVVVDSYG